MSRATGVERFGYTLSGEPVERCVIQAEGIRVGLLTFGATIQSLHVPSQPSSLVLGYSSLEGYLKNPACLGAVIGRFANRIQGAQALISGERYTFDPNQSGRHCLHGGREGFHLKPWRLCECDERQVKLSLTSPDGDMGFPGELSIEALYEVSPHQLKVTLSAVTDAPTLCNLTCHPYFNLTGAGSLEGHHLQVYADHLLEVDPELIPTGRLLPIHETPFDLRTPRPLVDQGQALSIDHHFTARGPDGLKPLASLEAGALCMTISSTSPGLQVYTGEGLSGASVEGQRFAPFNGVALEPQLWPDAPNHPHFPSALLNPGARYENVITFGFRRSSEPSSS